MLTEFELKRRLGIILGIEEHGDLADWSAIARLSEELLEEIPRTAPEAVTAYLKDCHIRRINRGFASRQRSILVRYLRSPDGSHSLS